MQIKKVREFEENPRKKLIIDLGDYRKTVLLVGTGRSGTTWLQELINSRNDFRFMFEPFHPMKNDLLKGWNYMQYLRCDERSDKYLKPATAILSGKIRHKWADQFNRRIFSQKRLIKDIHSHFFLKWIKHNFPEIPIIFLLRHPCAVANSQIQLKWDTYLDELLSQDELMRDFLNPFRREIEKSKDVFEKHIFMWCIENYVPLKQFREGEILLTFYENLCSDPQQEIERILPFIGESYSPDFLGTTESPSVVARGHSAIILGADLLTSWRNNISNEQVKRAVEICSIFGLQVIYDESDMPLLSEQDVLKVFSD